MEYAAAPDGMPHALLGMTKSRDVPPVMAGPPKGPLAFRVSAIRQGVTGTKCVAEEMPPTPGVGENLPAVEQIRTTLFSLVIAPLPYRVFA
jgi:hypothetical protein